MQTPDNGKGILSAVIIKIEDGTNKAKSITPINYIESENED